MHKVLALVKTTAGFTLIELIISIVIVVILTTIGITSFNNASRSNEHRQQALELKSLARKLRTDASAAIKPAGQCTTSGSVYGTYLTVPVNGTDYYYGTSCFDRVTNADYSTQSRGNLSTPFYFLNGGVGGTYITLLFHFEGTLGRIINVATPTIPPQQANYPSAFNSSTAIRVSRIGNPFEDYSVFFNPSGLVCERHTLPAAVCP